METKLRLIRPPRCRIIHSSKGLVRDFDAAKRWGGVLGSDMLVLEEPSQDSSRHTGPLGSCTDLYVSIRSTSIRLLLIASGITRHD